MIDPTSECEPPGASVRKTRKLHCAILGAVCALVIGLYAWSAQSLFRELRSVSEDKTYYNLLVEGFRAGQLHLKTEVPPELALLDEPSDPKANSAYGVAQHPLTDVSYYQGKLYLYFGVTPAVLLFWPYRELTGHYLFHKDAMVIFFSVGFLASVGLLWAVWRRYFMAVGVGVVALCALALGLANFILMCLPRGGVYEVAISCGYALTMVTLTLLWQTMHAGRGRCWWLAGASLAYGLAVGARPSLLFGAVILLVPVAMLWRARAALGQRRQLWTLFLAATGPITVIGLGLLLYNFLRFDDPFEFGQHHVLSWTGQHFLQPQYGIQLFSPRFLWFNIQVYFLELARWSGHFPFVHDIRVPAMPKDYRLFEHPFGILINLPLVWLALAVPLIWRGRLDETRCALRWFGVTLVLLFGICALTLCLFLAACSRYQVEFLPALVWLAVLGILGLERANAERPVWRHGFRWGWGLLLAVSVAFNLFAMLQITSDLYASSGVIFLRKGQVDEAAVQFQKALAWQPDNAGAQSGLGVVLFEQGKVPEDIRQQEKALRLRPDFVEAHNNLGLALFKQGRVAEAVGSYEQALRLRPDFVEAHYNLAFALFEQGNVGKGIEHLERAIHLKPDDADGREKLGLTLARQGKATIAAALFSEVVRLRPDAPAHYNLALSLVMQGNREAAAEHYREAIRLKPDWASALNDLAWILATHPKAEVRNGAEAVSLAGRACALTDRKEASFLGTLDAAYAESGRFSEAIVTAKQARELARATGQKELAEQAERRLKLYESGRPYRQE